MPLTWLRHSLCYSHLQAFSTLFCQAHFVYLSHSGFQAHWGLFGRVPCPFFGCLLVGQGSGYALYLLFVNSQKDAAAIPHAEWCLTRK